MISLLYLKHTFNLLRNSPGRPKFSYPPRRAWRAAAGLGALLRNSPGRPKSFSPPRGAWRAATGLGALLRNAGPSQVSLTPMGDGSACRPRGRSAMKSWSCAGARMCCGSSSADAWSLNTACRPTSHRSGTFAAPWAKTAMLAGHPGCEWSAAGQVRNRGQSLQRIDRPRPARVRTSPSVTLPSSRVPAGACELGCWPIA